MASSSSSPSPEASWLLENGQKPLSKEMRHGSRSSITTAHHLSASALRKKSELTLISKIRYGLLKKFLENLTEVFLGTKLSVLFLVIPFAIVAQYCNFRRPWVFALSLIGLVPLAERISFLTEQIAIYTGPTVGGLLNATCGNATELIIAILALVQHKVYVVKYSLLGSILSNLLLVLGTSLLCGGISNISKEQKFDRKQADVNSSLLLLGLLCHLLPLAFKFVGKSPELAEIGALRMSRAISVIMLIAYVSYLVFQLWTHRQFFEEQDDSKQGDSEEEDDGVPIETASVSFWSGIFWLASMTALVALLSEYVVDTIEAASNSWGLSIGFISVILLPIVGNAAEHAGAIIFAFKNKLDITLGVALGSATQIAMFVVPLSVIVSWVMGLEMDLGFNLLEISALAMSILVVTFALQDGTSHYMKGTVLLLCYLVIAASFFVFRAPSDDFVNLGL